MVVAEGMGDEHCQASGAEKSHRRTGTAARRDYASHVERWNRVPLDKGNGADNLSDERQTVGATKPQSSATMSLAGRWMRRVRFGLLCRSLYRDQYASQIVPSLPADPMLDHHRPNREEESAILALNYPPPERTVGEARERHPTARFELLRQSRPDRRGGSCGGPNGHFRPLRRTGPPMATHGHLWPHPLLRIS